MIDLQTEAVQKCTPELLASKNLGAIAAQINIGRKRTSNREIGNGTILALFGKTTGNAFLDVIETDPEFRHVKHLTQQGRLTIDTEEAQAAINAFVPAILTQQQADSLIALAYEDDFVTIAQVESQIDWSLF